MGYNRGGRGGTLTDILDQTDYSREQFVDVDWAGQVIAGVEFESCQFRGSNLAKVSFSKCRFLDCKFEHCDMGLMKVVNTRFRDTSFKECKLIGVNWTPVSAAVGLSFESCLLNYSIFSGLDLRRMALVRSSARETDLSDCNLEGAVLTGTDFLGARFSSTNLRKADLRGAANYQIDPSSNKIGKAKVSLPEAISLLRGLDVIIEDA